MLGRAARLSSSSSSSSRRTRPARTAGAALTRVLDNGAATRSSSHWDDRRRYFASSPNTTPLVAALPLSRPYCAGNVVHRAAPSGRPFSVEAASAASAVQDDVDDGVDDVDDGPPPFVPTPERKYRYFQNPIIDPSTGVAVIRFDDPDKKYNTVNRYLRDEARTLWDDEIHANPEVASVVWTSGKEDGFIAGADIFDIKGVEDKSELIPFIEEWLAFFQRTKSAGKPMVCAIHGPALGGGLEWALWCDYRVCTDSPATKLGLPEVKLGLLPGFGGTQNLHPLVGLQGAMDMMLTGKDVRAKKAKKMGLVNAVVDPARLESVAVATARGLADGSIKTPKPKKKSWMNWAIEDTPVGRNAMWKKVEEMVAKNTGGNYPAPSAIIDCVKYGLDHPTGNDKYKFERESFAKLAATTESDALIGIFEGMTKMKKHDFSVDEGTMKKVENVCVMGAGLMGAGIAQVTAEKGYSVVLKDRNDEAVGRGLSYMDGNWSKKVKRRRMTPHKKNLASGAVVPLTDASPSLRRHMARTDLVIEAVFEDLELKRSIIADVEACTPDRTVFATNTSAIPISSIANGSSRPRNIVGMHYFSPVPSMPLLEIIPHGGTEDGGEGTCDEALAKAFEVGTKQGKTCVVVKDVPGFYVNRCLGPFLVEVSALIRDGAPLPLLDSAMKNFGMPVGPVTLADEVGIDVISKVATFLSSADLGVRMDGGDVSLMEGMIERGWLGKKSGKGFYTYPGQGKGKRGGSKKSIDPEVQKYIEEFSSMSPNLDLTEEEVRDRLVTRFVNEAVKCLEDSIVENPTAGDMGLVFGTGFAPFRGGPFRYVDAVGADAYAGRMTDLAERYGPQFEPCQLLRDYAKSGKKFHG
eukprot:CAMPEP_0113589880 /NCGR_PEP_ID=MMETSP0015_2-20120614/36341_1 /TAXON_ID=2838 /ORGANISM="Odontella" /LENGTH=861 /DNA_ID=CAMNT_0000495963 /DNA_START=170 /DNA_END=2755 /DNA_ORIENTATION=+ /assembly_acc=CAM_ASM_000160